MWRQCTALVHGKRSEMVPLLKCYCSPLILSSPPPLPLQATPTAA